MKIRKKSRRTQRAALVELTDAEVLAAAKSDPDCPPLTPRGLQRMRRVVSRGNGLYGPARKR